jgi:hypothetical protein
MSIQWGATGFISTMHHKVLDNNTAPTEVLQAGTPFQIDVRWDVPAALAGLVGAGDTFRLRAYAESVGPGQELQLVQEIEPAVVNKLNYARVMTVNPNPLVGEGGVFNGEIVSGVYNIILVLQHLNGGVPTVHSGCSEDQPMIMFTLP